MKRSAGVLAGWTGAVPAPWRRDAAEPAAGTAAFREVGCGVGAQRNAGNRNVPGLAQNDRQGCPSATTEEA